MSCWADIPFECVAIKCAAQNQTVSGSLVRCITLPAVTACRRQHTHRHMRGAPTGDPASHRPQDKRSHPASGAQAGTGRSALRPETVAEMRGASEKRRRSCSVGGSESSETWDNGISLTTPTQGNQPDSLIPTHHNHCAEPLDGKT